MPAFRACHSHALLGFLVTSLILPVPAACLVCCCTAGNATCRVELRNTGNIRLANISVAGDVNDCNFALLWPAAAVNCSMTR